jgi:hypothetical protein
MYYDNNIPVLITTETIGLGRPTNMMIAIALCLFFGGLIIK